MIGSRTWILAAAVWVLAAVGALCLARRLARLFG